jgi:hypothetical protein
MGRAPLTRDHKEAVTIAVVWPRFLDSACANQNVLGLGNGQVSWPDEHDLLLAAEIDPRRVTRFALDRDKGANIAPFFGEELSVASPADSRLVRERRRGRQRDAGRRSRSSSA